MKKILFICQANVGRSQMAEAFYNHLVDGNLAISAGVIDVRKKYNYRPSEMIRSVMEEAGIDISKARIKVLNKNMLDGVDKIVVLCKKSMCPDFILKDSRTIFNGVTDPFAMNLDGTRKVRDQIKKIVINLN